MKIPNTIRATLACLTLLLTITVASADMRTITINGEIFTVFESGSIIDVTGPYGYHASGIRWGNGNINWTVNQGNCPFSPF